MGTLIEQVNLPSNGKCFFNLSQYPNGIYAIRLNYAKHVASKLLIKNNN
jgi:hypothetical protein